MPCCDFVSDCIGCLCCCLVTGGQDSGGFRVVAGVRSGGLLQHADEPVAKNPIFFALRYFLSDILFQILF